MVLLTWVGRMGYPAPYRPGLITHSGVEDVVRAWIKPPAAMATGTIATEPCGGGHRPTPARTARQAAIAVSSRSGGQGGDSTRPSQQRITGPRTHLRRRSHSTALPEGAFSPIITHHALPDPVRPRSRRTEGSHRNHVNHFLHYASGAASAPTMGVAMTTTGVSVPFVGQLERSPDGLLWVVLYRGTAVIRKERVRSRRRGRSRLIDIVLAATETFPVGLDRRPQGLDPCTRRIRSRREERGFGT
jgi:hypothetical protein